MLKYILKWQFIESNKNFLNGYLDFLVFGLRSFSVPILLRTFFTPWHRYTFPYPSTFNPVASFSALVGNIMSRVIGIILRTVFILIGLVFTFFIFVIGFCLFVVWLFLPFWSLYLIFLGLMYLSK